MKAKLRLTVLLLFFAVLLVWAVFYSYTAHTLAREAEANAGQSAQQIIGVLEEQFLQMEQVAFALSQSALAQDFAAETDLLRYHEKAGEVKAFLDGMQGRAGYVDNLIVFSNHDAYYRFRGSIGNTSATKLFYSVSPSKQPRHLVITLDGIQYIGYTVGIYQNENALGTIVMLIEDIELQNLFQRYKSHDTLQILLAADGTVITPDDSALVGMRVDAVRTNVTPLAARKIGFTPFEVIITARENIFWQSSGVFALTSLFTALLFALLLLAFSSFLNRHFFTPMLDIMQGVERLGSGEQMALPPYEDEGFRGLAERINDMLSRLDERNKEIYEARLCLQQSELTKQKAIIVSLKKQISAHFTVNVLNVIKSLAGLGEMQKTKDMCDGLAHLLRYANAADEYIGIMDELEVLRHYVGIMQIRYQGRFIAEYETDDVSLNVSIPRMLIQPIVENAIVHGLLKKEAGGKLLIRACIKNDALIVMVKDNGIGMHEVLLTAWRGRLRQAEELDPIALGLDHVALINIQRRVRSYYGANSDIEIDSVPGEGTAVTLTLPLNNPKDAIGG